MLSMGEAPARSPAADLAMKANLVAGVIPGHIPAIVPGASVMRVVVEFAEMNHDEVVHARLAALVEVRQGGQ